jgi:heme exporter protein B
MFNAKHILALLKKDVVLELRQKHNFYGLLLYIASTIYILYLSTNNIEINIWNSIFWIVQLFICVNAVAKSFLTDSRGRMLYYISLVHPVNYIIAKVLYNFLLMAFMSSISLLFYYFFLPPPSINALQFFAITILGGASISLVFTIMSAIAAKANQSAALIAIMGFPLITPLLLLLMRLSKVAFGEIFKDGAVLQVCSLIVGLDALIIALALILFPFLWKE